MNYVFKQKGIKKIASFINFALAIGISLIGCCYDIHIRRDLLKFSFLWSTNVM